MTAADEPTPDAVRAEAEERAHDRVLPDAAYFGLDAIELYVEAFVAGARFATAPTGAQR